MIGPIQTFTIGFEHPWHGPECATCRKEWRWQQAWRIVDWFRGPPKPPMMDAERLAWNVLGIVQGKMGHLDVELVDCQRLLRKAGLTVEAEHFQGLRRAGWALVDSLPDARTFLRQGKAEKEWPPPDS